MAVREPPRKGRFSSASLRWTILFFAASGMLSSTQAAVQRLVLQRSETAPPSLVSGRTELSVVPPFEKARVTIIMDGETIASDLRSPYRIEIDLGSIAVEHRITVVARGIGEEKTVRWNHVINEGIKPLSVTVRKSGSDSEFEATVTAPPDDPVVVVDFYGDAGLLQSFSRPPYRITLGSENQSGLIRATARTRGGREATDVLANGTSIHAESYDVRTVELLVSVFRDNGSIEAGLSASSFEILDDGQKARIVGVEPAMEQPISVALLLDASASMSHLMGDASRAALRFVKRTIRPQDRCSLFSIQSVPRREQPLTSDLPSIGTALNGIMPSGQTALYDAIRSAIRDLQQETDRRAIVVLSDGGDNASISSFEEVSDLARRVGIPIYAITYNSADEDLAGDRDRLRYLAVETGGFLTEASDLELDTKYGEIERALRGQYAIRYQITDISRPNQWRDVQVKVHSPELTARTVRGYFVP